MSIQAGKFRAKGVAAALGFTSDHNPQVAVELRLLDQGHENDSITWFGYFTEKTQERTLESLRILGWKTDDLSNLAGIGETEVSVTIEEDEYNGEVRLKAQWINRVGGIAMKERMSAEDARRFALQMKGAAIASRQGAPAPAPATSRTTPTQRPPLPRQPPTPSAGDELPEDKLPF